MSHKKIFEKWLNNPYITEKEKQKIERYQEEEIEKLFNYEPFRFGTAGIRKTTGYSPQQLNKYTYRVLALGYAKYLNSKYTKPSVLVVHDNRKQGQEFVIEICKTLKKQNIETFLSPNNLPLSTPILSYIIRKLNLSGGINITASHNPRIYNGFKIFNNKGLQLEEEEEQYIETLFPCLSQAFNIETKEFEKKYIDSKIIDDYFEDLKKSLPKIKESKNIKILFNAQKGSSEGYTKKLMQDLGFNLFEEHIFNESHIEKKSSVNPEDITSFKSTIEKANKKGINYVCLQDLDGDRAAIAEKQKDGSWYLFNGNEIGLLISIFKYEHIKITNPYIVISNTTGDLIKNIFKDIPIYYSNTGFKNISKIIDSEEEKGNNLLIAFEESIGSLIFPVHREKDGYQVISMMFLLIAKIKKDYEYLSEYLSKIYSKHKQWKSFTDCYENSNVSIKKISQIKPFETETYKLKESNFNSENNIVSWFYEKDSWIKFRRSGTENKLKIYYNLFSESQEIIKKEIDKFQKFFTNYFKQ